MKLRKWRDYSLKIVFAIETAVITDQQPDDSNCSCPPECTTSSSIIIFYIEQPHCIRLKPRAAHYCRMRHSISNAAAITTMAGRCPVYQSNMTIQPHKYPQEKYTTRLANGIQPETDPFQPLGKCTNEYRRNESGKRGGAHRLHR